MELLSRPFMGIPLWGWLAIAGIGIAAAVFLLPKFFGGASTAGSSGAAASQPSDPNIDPNTGVPYSVENAIDPKTGLPAYFDLFGTGSGTPPPPGGTGTGDGKKPGGAGGENPPGTTGNPPTPPPGPPPPSGNRTVSDIRSGHGPYGPTYAPPAAAPPSPPPGVTSGAQVSDWGKINNYNPGGRGLRGAQNA